MYCLAFRFGQVPWIWISLQVLDMDDKIRLIEDLIHHPNHLKKFFPHSSHRQQSLLSSLKKSPTRCSCNRKWRTRREKDVDFFRGLLRRKLFDARLAAIKVRTLSREEARRKAPFRFLRPGEKMNETILLVPPDPRKVKFSDFIADDDDDENAARGSGEKLAKAMTSFDKLKDYVANLPSITVTRNSDGGDDLAMSSPTVENFAASKEPEPSRPGGFHGHPGMDQGSRIKDLGLESGANPVLTQVHTKLRNPDTAANRSDKTAIRTEPVIISEPSSHEHNELDDPNSKSPNSGLLEAPKSGKDVAFEQNECGRPNQSSRRKATIMQKHTNGTRHSGSAKEIFGQTFRRTSSSFSTAEDVLGNERARLANEGRAKSRSWSYSSQYYGNKADSGMESTASASRRNATAADAVVRSSDGPEELRRITSTITGTASEQMQSAGSHDSQSSPETSGWIQTSCTMDGGVQLQTPKSESRLLDQRSRLSSSNSTLVEDVLEDRCEQTAEGESRPSTPSIVEPRNRTPTGQQCGKKVDSRVRCKRAWAGGSGAAQEGPNGPEARRRRTSSIINADGERNGPEESHENQSVPTTSGSIRESCATDVVAQLSTSGSEQGGSGRHSHQPSSDSSLVDDVFEERREETADGESREETADGESRTSGPDASGNAEEDQTELECLRQGSLASGDDWDTPRLSTIAEEEDEGSSTTVKSPALGVKGKRMARKSAFVSGPSGSDQDGRRASTSTTPWIEISDGNVVVAQLSATNSSARCPSYSGATSSRRRQDRAGVTFSTHRLRRDLEATTLRRARYDSAVYLAGVFDYLVGEVGDLAALAVKNRGRKIVQPRDINDVLKCDSDLNKLAGSAIIPGVPRANRWP